MPQNRRAHWETWWPATLVGGVVGLGGLVDSVRADVDPNSGIEFVTVGMPGNAPWPGVNDPLVEDNARGRGSVGYAYRIGKFEVSTAQWVEFFNAAFDRPSSDRIPFLTVPDGRFWGASSASPAIAGGRRWQVDPGEEMRPVGDITWRTAAIFCNWLHNGKQSNRAAFLAGAYDVSTFGSTPGVGFSDQDTRSPGAKYWIPSLDEQLKAFHFDPNRHGVGIPGWWEYANGRDVAPIYGPPGQLVNGLATEANSGWNSITYPGLDPWAVPLGAYSVSNPWGMFDTSGATAEWNEEVIGGFGLREWRRLDGSAWRMSGASAAAIDTVYSIFGGLPTVPDSLYGLRIAAAVPSPATVTASLLLLTWFNFPRRKRA